MPLAHPRAFARLFAALSAALLLLAALTVSASADPRDFELVNESSVVITHAYVSPSDVEDWEEDVLGDQVLYPGETITITFADFDGETCLYDIKVVGQQGQEGILYKIDLCSVTIVTFSDTQ